MKFLLLIILLSFQAFAYSAIPETKNVVLLTSVKHKKIDIEFKLERIFRNKLANFPFNLKVIHAAGIEKLRFELTNPQNDAVFWVSHGAFNKVNESTGITQKPLLLTYDYKNVAPLFAQINSNIQYLGVIGCNTRNIINYYRDTEENTNLSSFISKGKTIAQLGLKKALRKFKRAWRNARLKESQIIAEDFVTIQVTRTALDTDLPALIIENASGYLDIAPAQKANSSRVHEIRIPTNQLDLTQNLNLSFKTGLSPFVLEDAAAFGHIELNLKASSNSSWSLFSKPNGEPFGNNSRLFIFKGSLEDI